jgi:PAS domain S-box-containing protein
MGWQLPAHGASQQGREMAMQEHPLELPGANGSPRSTENRESSLARVAFEATWEWELATDRVSWSGGFAGMLGYAPNDMVGSAEWWRERVHPDDLDGVERAFEQALSSGAPAWSSEYRFRRKDGSWAWVAGRAVIERDGEGRAIRAMGAMIDVSELRETRERLRLFAEQLPARACATDRELRVVSDLGAGFAASPLALGKTVPELFARSPDRERVLEGCRRALAGESCKLEIDDGRSAALLHLVPRRDPAGNVIGVVGLALDVTERVRAERALRKSERLLVEAQALGQTGGWENDLVTGEISNTEENLRLFFGDDRSKGARLEDYAAVIHPDDRERVMQQRARLLAEDQPRDIEFRVVWPDGSARVLFGRATVVRDATGRPIRVYGTNVDVTERKRAEEELDRRVAQQAAVAQLGEDALRGGELRALFEEALDLVVRSSGVDFCEIAELLPDDTLLLRAARGWKQGLVGRARFPAGSGSLYAFTVVSGAPSVVDDLREETRFSVDPVILDQGIVSAVTVLIEGDGRPFGTLAAGTRARRTFSTHDVNFLQSMANVLAAAVEQNRAVRELDEKRKRLQALSRRLLDAQEAERRAIARELHDDFGAMLSALKLNLQKERGGSDAAEESLALVDQAIQQVRDLASDLRPAILDDLGLAEALSWYAGREARRAGLDLRLDVERVDGEIPAQLETACFRIVQEALTNAIRHSGARSLEVELRARDGAIRIVVRDDGKGFDPSAPRGANAAGKSHGLLNMQERAELAGGGLEIDSAPGRGTTIRATFRIPQESER